MSGAQRTVEVPQWVYENAVMLVVDVRAKGIGSLPAWAREALPADVISGRRPFAMRDAFALAAVALRHAGAGKG